LISTETFEPFRVLVDMLKRWHDREEERKVNVGKNREKAMSNVEYRISNIEGYSISGPW